MRAIKYSLILLLFARCSSPSRSLNHSEMSRLVAVWKSDSLAVTGGRDSIFRLLSEKSYSIRKKKLVFLFGEPIAIYKAPTKQEIYFYTLEGTKQSQAVLFPLKKIGGTDTTYTRNTIAAFEVSKSRMVKFNLAYCILLGGDEMARLQFWNNDSLLKSMDTLQHPDPVYYGIELH